MNGAGKPTPFAEFNARMLKPERAPKRALADADTPSSSSKRVHLGHAVAEPAPVRRLGKPERAAVGGKPASAPAERSAPRAAAPSLGSTLPVRHLPTGLAAGAMLPPAATGAGAGAGASYLRPTTSSRNAVRARSAQPHAPLANAALFASEPCLLDQPVGLLIDFSDAPSLGEPLPSAELSDLMTMATSSASQPLVPLAPEGAWADVMQIVAQANSGAGPDFKYRVLQTPLGCARTPRVPRVDAAALAAGAPPFQQLELSAEPEAALEAPVADGTVTDVHAVVDAPIFSSPAAGPVAADARATAAAAEPAAERGVDSVSAAESATAAEHIEMETDEAADPHVPHDAEATPRLPSPSHTAAPSDCTPAGAVLDLDWNRPLGSAAATASASAAESAGAAAAASSPTPTPAELVAAAIEAAASAIEAVPALAASPPSHAAAARLAPPAGRSLLARSPAPARKPAASSADERTAPPAGRALLARSPAPAPKPPLELGRPGTAPSAQIPKTAPPSAERATTATAARTLARSPSAGGGARATPLPARPVTASEQPPRSARPARLVPERASAPVAPAAAPHASASDKRASVPAPGAATAAAYSGGTAASSSSAEKLATHASLAELLAMMADMDSDKWQRRADALVAARTQIERGRLDLSAQAGGGALPKLAKAVVAQAGDLRSQIVKEAAGLIRAAAAALRHALPTPVADAWLGALVKNTFVTIKIIATSSRDAALELVALARPVGSFPFLCKLLCADKHAAARRCAAELLLALAADVGADELRPHCGAIEDALIAGLGDADAGTRPIAAKLYWCYVGHFAERAQPLELKLDSAQKKIVARAR
jgi:hypothetical protein